MGIGTWVGSTLRLFGTGQSGKLSGAPEDEPSRKAIAFAVSQRQDDVGPSCRLGMRPAQI